MRGLRVIKEALVVMGRSILRKKLANHFSKKSVAQQRRHIKNEIHEIKTETAEDESLRIDSTTSIPINNLSDTDIKIDDLNTDSAGRHSGFTSATKTYSKTNKSIKDKVLGKRVQSCTKKDSFASASKLKSLRPRGTRRNYQELAKGASPKHPNAVLTATEHAEETNNSTSDCQSSQVSMANLLNAILDALHSWLGEIKVTGKVTCDNKDCGQVFCNELEMLFHWVHCTIQTCYGPNEFSCSTPRNNSTATIMDLVRKETSIPKNSIPQRTRNVLPVEVSDCNSSFIPINAAATTARKCLACDPSFSSSRSDRRQNLPSPFTYSPFCNGYGKSVRKRPDENGAAVTLKLNWETNGAKQNNEQKLVPKTLPTLKAMLNNSYSVSAKPKRKKSGQSNAFDEDLHETKTVESSLEVNKISYYGPKPLRLPQAFSQTNAEQCANLHKKDDVREPDYVLPDLDVTSTNDIVTVKTETDSEICLSGGIARRSQEDNLNGYLGLVLEHEKSNVFGDTDSANGVSDVTKFSRDQASPITPFEPLIEIHYGSRFCFKSKMKINRAANRICNKVSVDSVMSNSDMLMPLQDLGSPQIKSEVELECESDI